MLDFLKNLMGGIIPSRGSSGIQTPNILERLSNVDLKQQASNTINKLSGANYKNMLLDVINQMQTAYGGYTGAAEQALANAPKVDLSGYSTELGSLKESLMDDYLRSAGQIEGVSSKALDEALGAYQSSLSTYRNLSNQGMPGEDIYRQSIGAGTTSAIQAAKDLGANINIADLVGNQSNQLRDLAVQSASYKQQNLQNLANAYANYGQQTQAAYNTRMNALQSAAGLRGTGYTTAANLTGQQANLAQTQYQYNEFIPWQMGIQYDQNMAMANNPYQAKLGLYGDLYGLQMAQTQQLLSGLMGTYSNFMGAAREGFGNALSLGFGGGTNTFG